VHTVYYRHCPPESEKVVRPATITHTQAQTREVTRDPIAIGPTNYVTPIVAGRKMAFGIRI
jgi:hypothetical protein